MTKYTASAFNDEDSINAFTTIQFRVFESRKRSRIVLCSAVFLAFGVINLFNQLLSASCLLIGCLLLVDLRYIPKRTAKQIIGQTQNADPIKYEFCEEGIRVYQNGKSDILDYLALQKLISWQGFYCIFINERLGYIIEKRSIQPSGETGFESYMENKTGRKWENIRTAFMTNIFELIKRLRKE